MQNQIRFSLMIMKNKAIITILLLHQSVHTVNTICNETSEKGTK